MYMHVLTRVHLRDGMLTPSAHQEVEDVGARDGCSDVIPLQRPPLVLLRVRPRPVRQLQDEHLARLRGVTSMNSSRRSSEDRSKDGLHWPHQTRCPPPPKRQPPHLAQYCAEKTCMPSLSAL